MHNAMQTTVAMDWHWDSLTHHRILLYCKRYQFMERHLVLVENHVISFERFSFRIF